MLTHEWHYRMVKTDVLPLALFWKHANLNLSVVSKSLHHHKCKNAKFAQVDTKHQTLCHIWLPNGTIWYRLNIRTLISGNGASGWLEKNMQWKQRLFFALECSLRQDLLKHGRYIICHNTFSQMISKIDHGRRSVTRQQLLCAGSDRIGT